MELKCPQCGKWMAISQEELVMHDSQVVCPQCLAVCVYDDGKLVVRNDSDAPYRHTATAKIQNNTRFCHQCGRELPNGISFCPYCGADLKAPFVKAEPEIKPKNTEEQAAPKATPEPVKASAEKRTSNVANKRQPTSEVEDKLRTVSHRYNSVHPHLQQNGTKPGMAFKIIAYTLIVLLLALLVAIIIAGINIETRI